MYYRRGYRRQGNQAAWNNARQGMTYADAVRNQPDQQTGGMMPGQWPQLLTNLLMRLTVLENRDKPGPLIGKPKTGPRVSTTASPRFFSFNLDFACVSKCLYRIVQLKHHMTNWMKLPQKLEYRLKKFAQDIKPPFAEDDILRRELDEATQGYSARICKIVQGHLERQLKTAELEASRLNPMDVELAQQTADKYITNRLGKKLDVPTKTRLLEEAAAKVGTCQQQDTVQPASESNTAAGLTQTPKGKRVNVTTVNSVSPLPTSFKRRRVASDDAVVLSNRFSPLTVEVSTEDLPGTSCQPSIMLDRNPVSPPVQRQSQNKNRADAPAVATPLKHGRTGGAGTPSNKVSRPSVEQSTEDMTVSSHQPTVRLDRISLSQPTAQCQKAADTITGIAAGGKTVKGLCAGLVVHDKDRKDKWTLEAISDSTKVLVIGDSNLKQVTKVPDNWEIHCFPGAKFSHVSRLFDRFYCPNSVEHIVLQVGINHRDDASDRPKMELCEVESKLQGLNEVSVAYVGVSTAASLDPRQVKIITKLNQLMSKGSFAYIPPLQQDLVDISPTDPYGIHHTAETTARVIDSMVKHIEGKSKSLN